MCSARMSSATCAATKGAAELAQFTKAAEVITLGHNVVLGNCDLGHPRVLDVLVGSARFPTGNYAAAGGVEEMSRQEVGSSMGGCSGHVRRCDCPAPERLHRDHDGASTGVPCKCCKDCGGKLSLPPPPGYVLPSIAPRSMGSGRGGKKKRAR